MKGTLRVFFYGLFMDINLLASKNIHVQNVTVGSVNDCELRIGERASLVPRGGHQAFGLLVEMEQEDLNYLYSETSVSEYVPEELSVLAEDGTLQDAICFNLPADKLIGTNPKYAADLASLATKLGFPEEYCNMIAQQGI